MSKKLKKYDEIHQLHNEVVYLEKEHLKNKIIFKLKETNKMSLSIDEIVRIIGEIE